MPSDTVQPVVALAGAVGAAAGGVVSVEEAGGASGAREQAAPKTSRTTATSTRIRRNSYDIGGRNGRPDVIGDREGPSYGFNNFSTTPRLAASSSPAFA